MSMSHARGKVVVGHFIDDGKSWESWQVFPDGKPHRIDFSVGYHLDMSGLCNEVQTSASLEGVHIFSCRLRFAVSQQIKDAIEKTEPGLHQFQSLIVHPAKHEKLSTTYYLLNVCNRVQAIDPNATTRPFGNRHYALGTPSLRTDTQLVIRKEVVSGMAIWIDEQYQEHFISNELHEKVTLLGASNLRFTQITEI